MFSTAFTEQIRPETAAAQFDSLSQQLLRWSGKAIAAYGGGR